MPFLQVVDSLQILDMDTGCLLFWSPVADLAAV